MRIGVIGTKWRTCGSCARRWCVSPVRCFESDAWRDLAPGLEPGPGKREPWAEAHVETARRFLGMLGKQPPRVDPELATVREAATVQRILSAAMESEDDGRRIRLD